MKEHIFLASPHMSEEGYEQKFVKEAFDTNWIAPLGKNVNEFEKEVCIKTGAKVAVALSSGTAAIHLALKLTGVKNGDLVFCSSLTFSASANPIIYEGGKPIFIDSDEKTWNMSPDALEKAFIKYKAMGKSPKAVIVVHLYGMSANMEAIMKICKKYKCPVIEDAAESLGTLYQLTDDMKGPDGQTILKGEKRSLGTMGDYGILSFNGNKIITCSGGGMLLCNTKDAEEKAKKALYWATQAREPARWYQHTELGYNYRMSNVAAGIGRGQLMVLKQRVEKKRELYQIYKDKIGCLQGVSLMPMQENIYSNCWLTVIQLHNDCPVKPMDIINVLEENNIESRPVWKPMHLQPFFSEYDFVSQMQESIKVINKENGADNSVAGQIFDKGVCLPSDTKMDYEDMERICSVIKNLWR
ncbi:MAG: aminotransferase class I/II-fold pyridoxal phosphate-dependent enzyme [Lachnospiraceae bacterium]